MRAWVSEVRTSNAPGCSQAQGIPGIPIRRRRDQSALWAALLDCPQPWRVCRGGWPGRTKKGENAGSGSWDHLPRASFRSPIPLWDGGAALVIQCSHFAMDDTISRKIRLALVLEPASGADSSKHRLLFVQGHLHFPG
jgi:hypothetical protein